MIRKEEFSDPSSGTVLDVSRDLNMERLIRTLILKDTSTGDRTTFDFAAGTQCLGRGDEKRSSTFSCLGIRKLPRDVVGPSRGHVMVMLLNDRKVESEETGKTFLSIGRHKNLTLCGQGAFSRYFFRRFCIENEQPIGFRKGRQNWYRRSVFKKAVSGCLEEQLSYSASYDQARSALLSEGIDGGHVTHLMRVYGASTIEMKAQGHMNTDQAKRLGGWNQNSHDLCYNNDVPVGAVMVQAGFPATDYSRNFYVPRAPDSQEIIPEEFLSKISFFAEAKEFLEFASVNPGAILEDNFSICGSSINFAHLLVECAKILCEDAHDLKTKYPNLTIHRYAPFNTPAFIKWSTERAARQRSSAVAQEKLIEASALLGSPIRESLRVVQNELHAGFEGVWAQLAKFEPSNDLQNRGESLRSLMSPSEDGKDTHLTISVPASTLDSPLGMLGGKLVFNTSPFNSLDLYDITPLFRTQTAVASTQDATWTRYAKGFRNTK